MNIFERIIERMTLKKVLKYAQLKIEDLYLEREITKYVGLEKEKVKIYFIREFNYYNSGVAIRFLILIIHSKKEFTLYIKKEEDYMENLKHIIEKKNIMKKEKKE